TFSVFVGTSSANGKIAGTIGLASQAALSLTGHVVTSQAAAESAVAAVTSAVTLLGTAQATVGTLENRLQFAIGLAQSQIVNNKAAESRIRDANVAEEASNLTKYQILTQSGVAALAQANSSSSSVLSLLR